MHALQPLLKHTGDHVSIRAVESGYVANVCEAVGVEKRKATQVIAICVQLESCRRRDVTFNGA